MGKNSSFSGKQKESNVINKQDLIDMIVTTVNKTPDARFRRQTPGTIYPDMNENTQSKNFSQRDRNWPQSNPNARVHGSEWFNENDLNESFDFMDDDFRPSSTRHHSNMQILPTQVNILKWKFYFSDLDRNEDPKSLDVDAFFQKVKDHGCAENMKEEELMKKIQQLLRGPASDWYTHARRYIHTWREFRIKLSTTCNC